MDEFLLKQLLDRFLLDRSFPPQIIKNSLLCHFAFTSTFVPFRSKTKSLLPFDFSSRLPGRLPLTG